MQNTWSGFRSTIVTNCNVTFFTFLLYILQEIESDTFSGKVSGKPVERLIQIIAIK